MAAGVPEDPPTPAHASPCGTQTLTCIANGCSRVFSGFVRPQPPCRSHFELSNWRSMTQAPHCTRGPSVGERRSAPPQCPGLDSFLAETIPMALLRTLLVDDDDTVREVVAIRLACHDRLQIVGSVASGEEAILAAASLRPDLVILDLSLPGLSGMDTLRSVIKSLPQVKIVVLSARQSQEQVQQAFERGAAGYVFKPSSGIDLIDAVDAVIAGQKYASPAIRRYSTGADDVPIESPAAPCPAPKPS